jgi:hypothetical protein
MGWHLKKLFHAIKRVGMESNGIWKFLRKRMVSDQPRRHGLLILSHP